MKKFSFKNDYSEGCHPDILKALAEANTGQQDGYGSDDYSDKAKDRIRKITGNPEAAVYFVSGGTQANLIVIASLLQPFESVISAGSGHINVHETAAIEATGHRIESVPGTDGKLRPEDIRSVLDKAEPVHMARPRLVYISNATEIGTHYTLQELTALSQTCRQNGLLLFMDGARLASALTARTNDLSLEDIARLTDVFYIGGTKNGTLLGEAVVFNHPDLQKDFAYHLKQRGALLAKGYLLGVQFATLFEDDLFFRLGKHANAMAGKIRDAFTESGYPFLTDTATNQLFPVLPNRVIDHLGSQFDFYTWEKRGGSEAVVRIVTSWATPEEQADRFIALLRSA